MFKGNIVNIVQHSHLYNSFLLIIVACIVILHVLVAILYRDHVGFCVIVTFSSIHKLKWPVLLSYLREWNQTGAELTHVWHTKFFLELWCNFVSLYWVVYMCAGYMYIDLILFWKVFLYIYKYSCTSEPYNKICFDIIHIHVHCNKQLIFILTVSQ